jgi:MFS family permease
MLSLSRRVTQNLPAPSLAAVRGGLGRGFAALGVRNYRLYWSGQVVSLIGTWMQQVSLPWLVLALGGSAFQLGLVAALQFAPSLILAPFGGVLADRVDKRRALIGTQVAAMLHAATLFVLTATGVVEIPMVLALAFLLGLVNAADMPIRQSLAADLVPRDTLHNAIALNAIAFNTARVLGPAIAGLIIAAGASAFGSATAGVAANLAINVATYAGVLTGLLRMDPRQIRRPARPERHPPVLDSLREGIGYAVRMPIVLWSLVLLGGVALFGMNFQVLLPLFAIDVLHLDADGYGALFASMGFGTLAGSITLAFLRRRPAVAFMLAGGAAFAVFEIGLSLSRSVWLAAPLMIGAGYAVMLMINTVNTTVQANVSDALRGRVMALYVTVFAGTAPLGGLLAGGLAEAFGAPYAFAVGAILSMVTIGVVAWRLRVAAAHGHLGVTSIETVVARPGSDRADAPGRIRPPEVPPVVPPAIGGGSAARR